MRVLVACEMSGKVRDRYRARGHDAYSCDILPNDSPYHIQGDVLPILNGGWDQIIAFPPCTRLCNSGVRWLHERNLWRDMHLAAVFFRRILNADCEHIAVENPIMHKYAVERIGRKADQFIQPWQFGHPETKRTGLHLKGLPKLVPTNIVEGREQSMWKMAPSADRSILRSTTYDGIADAMASQWG